jgi:dihydrofolate reductase
MRKLILKMHVSLDGFGTPSGEVDWIFPAFDEDLQTWEVDGLWQAGVHIMGAAAYGYTAAHWPTSIEPFAPPMNEIPKVVFSSTMERADWGPASIASGDLVQEVERLKRERGRAVLAHGGARFVQALSRHRLVDEYRLVVHPIALGAGLPLFSDSIDLELLSARTFATGAVALTYEPTRVQSAPRAGRARSPGRRPRRVRRPARLPPRGRAARPARRR